MLILLSSAALILMAAGTALLSRRRKRGISETSEANEDTLTESPDAGSEIKFNDREIEILRMISEGRKSKYMAERLCLSLETIYWYRKRILAKLGVNSPVAAVKEAVRRGIIRAGEGISG